LNEAFFLPRLDESETTGPTAQKLGRACAIR
jgi:hypothetical protein